MGHLIRIVTLLLELEDDPINPFKLFYSESSPDIEALRAEWGVVATFADQQAKLFGTQLGMIRVAAATNDSTSEVLIRH